jgi:GntR family transcriptional regulator
MFIRIETSSGVPITRQIMDQIRAHCAAGALATGDRLPSVRVLARELAVNQNTILRVYERLTAEGLLERRHGDGTYVTASPPSAQLKTQRKLLAEEVSRLVRRAGTLGVGPEELHKQIDAAFQRERREAETKGQPDE